MSKTCPVCATIYPDADAFCPKDGSTLRPVERNASLVGSVIADRYLVNRLLGEGGMGQVYLASHVRLPQQAAIKVLNAAMVQDAGAIARFNREAANAARIEHERVARVFDFGETSDGLVYLAMEFVPGRTLRALLEEHPRLAPARVANLVYQVAEGLDAAHRLNIVHRDLKPDNVLVVTDEAGVDRCKVVDFGIAKALNESDRQKTQLTQVGSIVGTPEYMSPEQVLGEEIDARSDVYALALVAFHLLTGALPFGGATPERMLTARLIDAPSPLRVAAPDVAWPDAVQAVFDRALASDVAARTPSALQFAEELVTAVEGWTGDVLLRGRTPLSTRPVPAPASTGVASAGVASAGVASATLTTDAVTDARSNGTAGAGRSSGSPTRLIAAVGGLAAVAVVALVLMQGGGESAAREADPVGATTESTALQGSGPTGQPDAGEGRTSAPDGGALHGAAAGGRATAERAPDGGTAAPPAVRTPTAGPEGSGAASTAPGPNGGSNPSTSNTGGPADDAAAARRELESLEREVLDPTPALAAQAIPRFTALLGRVQSAGDSARVYAKLAILHFTTDNQPAACVAFRGFKRQARTENQLRLVREMTAIEFFAQCP